MQRLWTGSEADFLRGHFDKLTNSELSEKLGRSIASIKGKLKQLDLFSERPEILRRRANSLYSVDLSYFAIPNIKNSYWAGFIAADGSVSPEKNTLQITLNSVDRNHLEKLREDLNYSGKIATSLVNPAQIGGRLINSSPASRLAIYGCPEILNDLEQNFNITKAKTYTLKPPCLKDPLLVASFIKGYLDGDGSIIVQTDKNGYPKYTINFTGNQNLLFYIRDFSDSVAPSVRNMKKTAIPVKVSKGNYFSYTLAYKRAERLLKYLHSIDTQCLSRKWDKISSLVSE